VVAVFTGLAHIALFCAAIGLLALALYIVFGKFNILEWTDTIVPKHEILMRSLAAACGLLMAIIPLTKQSAVGTMRSSTGSRRHAEPFTKSNLS
jgi:hypothetical protein